jgi:hypothetical protein
MKQNIKTALQAFASNDLYIGAKALLNSLGYTSDKDAITIDIACNHEAIKQAVGLFQLTDEDLSNQSGLLETGQFNDKIVYSFLFVAIELKDKHYNRTVLRQITHSINQQFQMPVIILFRYAGLATLSIIDFRLNKKDNSKDVLGKVTSIKDINLVQPHRAQLDILAELSLDTLKEKYAVNHFAQLHTAWQKTLDTKTLNDKFYKELSYWYFWAVQKVQFPNPNNDVHNSETSVIRLLTRLMFIWFIKEKGLVNPDLFNRNKLDALIDLAKEGSYYRAIIQNLFFATLNCPIENRAFATDGTFVENKNEYCVNNLYRYTSLFKINETDALALFESTPFLNGGLFECLDTCDNAKHKKIYVDGFSRNLKQAALIPNELFFADVTSVDLNDIYDTRGKNYTVKGLIEILNSYKFTVEENTPLDVEIALDPELLGKVFENLLASYNPETGATARKATGSFYTPREIVDYMVTSSLKNYLSDTIEDSKLDSLLAYDHNLVELSALDKKKLIDKLDALTIIDPAIGSGAFPMGLLHKITHLLGKIDPENKLWKQKLLNATPAALRSSVEKTLNNSNLDYARKLHLIQSTIYGVDIQPVAVQIAKLRFFISLVIEQNPNTDKLDNYGITALPNLETKFVCANSLLPLKTYDKSILTLEEINQAADTANNLFTNTDMFFADIPSKEKEIADNREQHFYANNREKKKAIIDTDKQLRAELSDLLIHNGMPAEQAGMLAAWNPYDPNQSAGFFDAEFMFGITKGFDIVIGNPPYLRVQGIDKVESEKYKKIYKSATGKYDLYAIFAEKSINLINDSGIVNFIMPHKWINSDFGSGLRSISKNKISKFISFKEYQVFNASTYTSLVWFKHKSNVVEYIGLNKDLKTNEELSLFLLSISDESYTKIENKKLDNNAWTFSQNNILSILEKLDKQPLKIKDVFEGIYQGVVSTGDDIFQLKGGINDNLFTGFSKKLNKNITIESAIVRPLLKGDDIKRYAKLENSYFIIYPHYLDDAKNTKPFEEKELEKKFPLAFKYLSLFKEELIKKKIKYKTNSVYWYSLHRSRDIFIFEQEKIVMPYLSVFCQLSYDNSSLYGNTKFSSIIKKQENKLSYKFYLSLMNSMVMWFFIKNTSSIFRGSYFAFTNDTIENFPLPKIKLEDTKPFITLVDQILALKAENPKADTLALEAEIDQMVYKLYGLTDDEIKLVEGN